MNRLEKISDGWKRFAPYAAIPLRWMVGYGLLSHGVAKWNKGPAAFAGILHAIGVPLPQFMSWLTIITEIGSGVALLIGAFVALASIPAIVLLVVAIFTVHLPYGFSSIKLLSFANGRAQFGPPGYECDLLYIACLLALILMGPSPWSMDRLVFRSRIGFRTVRQVTDSKGLAGKAVESGSGRSRSFVHDAMRKD